MPVVLITGVAGFLGSHIAREMFAAGWKVAGTDLAPDGSSTGVELIHYLQAALPDLSIADFISRCRPDACIHCAGKASVGDSFQDPASDFASGVSATAGLLDALAEHASGCRTIFLSSAAVYGQPEALPVSEDARILPLSPYGYHKRMSELLLEQAARLRNVPGAVARIFSAYGTGLRKQVLWEIASQLATNGVARLRGTGSETRDFIHAKDIASAVRLLVEKAPCAGEAYNLGSQTETSIREVAELLTAFFPGALPPEYEGKTPTGDPMRWRADCSKIQALGFHPSIPLKEGLQELAESLQSR